ncbi:hypothetical protein HJC23_005499 [Cyclotella cryptica]|uniref:Uncharacterized protein n=1 Tax=Cyclotella cryptica TaxID=29204 RepID=A0ABD3PFZ5_9STRA|eukprot:CCRYP_014876-RA/>CCRYP_014876-RA protein AED:0.12 eAED:0.12 QI:0/-1/0/1/-1/1/1/0/586
MSNKTPLFLLALLATASLAYLFLGSRHDNDHDPDDDPHGDHDDTHVDDLHLTQEDVSDDVTVQVKNGRESTDSPDVDDDVHDDDDEEDAVAVEEDKETPVRASTDAASSPQESSHTLEMETEFTHDILERPLLSTQQQQQQEREEIRQEAMKNASQILQSMPAIPLVYECLGEVHADQSSAEGVVDSRGIMTTDSIPVKEFNEVEEPMDVNVPDTTTIHTEQSIPIATDDGNDEDDGTAVAKRQKIKYPKTPPIKLHSTDHDDEDDIMEAPTDTTDYHTLSSYWKKKSQKHIFSPPVVDPVTSVVVQSGIGDGSPIVKGSSPATRNENAAAAAAAAGLMVAGVVNVLDHVLLSPATSLSSSGHAKGEGGKAMMETEGEDEDVPLMDVSIMEEEEAEEEMGVNAEGDEPPVESNPDTHTQQDDELQQNDDEEEETSDDRHLIVPSGSDKSSGESENSLSEKSSNDDYVKIVKMASGDPMTESELFAWPVDVVTATTTTTATSVERVEESEGGKGGELEIGGADGGGESAGASTEVALTSEKSDGTTDVGKDQEEIVTDGMIEEEGGDSPQKGKGKSKSKKKKRGKKK